MTINRGAVEPADPAAALKRILWLLALAVVAVMMLRVSLTNMWSRTDPSLALRIDPANAEAAEARADQLLLENLANRREAATLARRALERSPLSAAGARILAATGAVAGDAAATRRLLAYSESVSRRDLPAQLWLIQNAVEHDDVPAALHHYDIALRVLEPAKGILFPVLIKAISQPAVVDGLIDTLAAKPSWADPFLEQISRDAQDYDGLARLLTGLARRGYMLPDGAVVTATARMIEAGKYDPAWQIYAADRHDAARGGLRDPGFARIGDAGTPFDWALLGGNGVSGGPRLYGTGTRLAYSAATGAGGVVARQLLLLPAGAFVLGGRAFNVAPDSVPVQMRLTCAGTGAAIGAVATARGGRDGTAFAGRFTVPAGCPAQWLEIVADGGDSPAGASGELGALRIRPARGGGRS